MTPVWRLFAVIFATAGLVLAGCSDTAEEAVAAPEPVHFESGDECHVCGMIIERFPGPKGQAITQREGAVRKFCSTRDMFSWALQPENTNRDHALYVHDMAETDWDHADDTRLIDAREAFYVAGSRRQGAMGPTLASFADVADAQAFADEHGGEVLGFGDITLEHMSALRADMEGSQGHGGH